MSRREVTSFLKLPMLLLIMFGITWCTAVEEDLLEMIDDTEHDSSINEGGELLEMLIEAPYLPETEKKLDAPKATPCAAFVNAENDQSQNTHAMRLFLSAIRAANADLTRIACLSASTQARTLAKRDFEPHAASIVRDAARLLTCNSGCKQHNMQHARNMHHFDCCLSAGDERGGCPDAD